MTAATSKEVFLENTYEREYHSSIDSTQSINSSIDLTLDSPNSDSGFNYFDSLSLVSETESNGLQQNSSFGSVCDNESSQLFPVSFGNSNVPNIAIPSYIPSAEVCAGGPDLRLSNPVCPLDYATQSNSFYLAAKKRRLQRMSIIKQKRALGLISAGNCRKVRYKQKQVTAFQKTRVNGKFSCGMCVCLFKQCYSKLS